MHRRHALAQIYAPIIGLGLFQISAHKVWAGAQREEDLSDSIRTALSAAVSLGSQPPEPVFANAEDKAQYLLWLQTMNTRLARRRQLYLTTPEHRAEFLQTVWYESKRAALEPSLVLGLIQVESAFRKYAISSVGARGYMQIMPFWARAIGDGDVSKLFHMQTNLRFGCVILRFYLQRERGNMFMALGRYNGSRGRAVYPNAVYAGQRNWLL